METGDGRGHGIGYAAVAEASAVRVRRALRPGDSDPAAGVLRGHIYLCAVGTGGAKAVIVSFGAEQFDDDDSGKIAPELERKASYFSWYYGVGNLAVVTSGTLLVWEDKVSWGLGYGIPALLSAVTVAVFLAGTAAYQRHQPPGGSPLTRVVQVVVAAVSKCSVEAPGDASELHECEGDDGMSAIQGSRRLAHTDQFRSVALLQAVGLHIGNAINCKFS